MLRYLPVLLSCVLVGSLATAADPVPEDLTKVIAVQRAIVVAKQHLAKDQAPQAIAVLEGELVNANGHAQFLKLLQDAYRRQLTVLEKTGETSRIEAMRRKLNAIAGTPEKVPVASDSPPLSPMPPLPGSGSDLALPSLPNIPESPSTLPSGPAPSVQPDIVSPLENTLREPGPLELAGAAFQDRNYPLAKKLFAEALRGRNTLTPLQAEQYGYARLHTIAIAMAKPSRDRGALETEVREVVAEGNPKLQAFADRVLRELKSGPAAAAPEIRPAVAVIDSPKVNGQKSASFVVDGADGRMAQEIAMVAEAARTELTERWVGPAGATWLPRCEIVVHADGAAYARATGKSESQMGHCTVSIVGERVLSRRIDVRADDRSLFEITLPNQITQVLLAEWFSEQPLPRWAVIGIASLSESPDGVARYRKAANQLLYQQKLFAVAAFVDLKEIPNAESVTQYCAESVSLVEFLVRQRGAKPFLAFLREAPRRGFEKALKTHYGIQDAAELQAKWVKHLSGEGE
jgi:hypothetical protein